MMNIRVEFPKSFNGFKSFSFASSSNAIETFSIIFKFPFISFSLHVLSNKKKEEEKNFFNLFSVEEIYYSHDDDEMKELGEKVYEKVR